MENERLQGELDRTKKALENKHKKMKTLHYQLRRTKELRRTTYARKEMVNALREELVAKGTHLRSQKSCQGNRFPQPGFTGGELKSSNAAASSNLYRRRRTENKDVSDDVDAVKSKINGVQQLRLGRGSFKKVLISDQYAEDIGNNCRMQ
ncbi:regulation of mitotic centrosome separation [Desmophyllum pertusum]|uniref:Regulation of mitotic centrosome separation n=1 Tax=Desmophyllum pertusum TaxID=174260 RepID=A0A9X0D3B6_9CNID|nr:regulation of mitotic centrosome separation [Desmophyllum pertusum]